MIFLTFPEKEHQEKRSSDFTDTERMKMVNRVTEPDSLV